MALCLAAVLLQTAMITLSFADWDGRHFNRINAPLILMSGAGVWWVVKRRKLNNLDLGRELGNISEACRKLGVSRQHYYDIKQTIEEEGLEGLMEKTAVCPGPAAGQRLR